MQDHTTAPQTDKPAKPTPEFPLFPHATRRWAKKVKGKMYYFGSWDDPMGALAEWEARKAEILAGVAPPPVQARNPDAPRKPYKDFPLYPHARGQWAKKIKGRTYYFGPWEDPDGAKAEYERTVDAIVNDRPIPPKTTGVPLRDVCNVFLTGAQERRTQGTIRPRTFGEYKAITDRLIAKWGAGRQVDTLGPSDFQELLADMAKVRRGVALRNMVQRVKSVFRYAHECGTIKDRVVYGPGFKGPSRSVIRRERAQQPQRFLDAPEIRLLLDASGIQMRAMILLAVNTGMGNTDVSELDWSHLNLDRGLLDFPRPKTGILRRATLWPETVAALRKLQTWSRARHTTGEARGLVRYRPERAEDADAVFLTRQQRRFVLHTDKSVTDSVGLSFGKLLRAVEVEGAKGRPTTLKRAGVNFYALRHVFETVAGGAGDQAIVNLIMGHDDPTMAGQYREWLKVADERELARLRVVTDRVRAWLWPDVVKAEQEAAAKAAEQAKTPAA